MKTYSAFTVKSEGLLSILKTDILIDSDQRDNKKIFDRNEPWCAQWDTGASMSSIDRKIVDKLGLIPVGKETINTANGTIETYVYLIDFILPNHVTVKNVFVTCTNLGLDSDVLIGMDIISLGDFSITNVDGKTTFSFRIPSVVEIDYVNGNC